MLRPFYLASKFLKQKLSVPDRVPLLKANESPMLNLSTVGNIAAWFCSAMKPIGLPNTVWFESIRNENFRMIKSRSQIEAPKKLKIWEF